MVPGETNESTNLIKYLVKTVPNCLEVKSVEGLTPLAVAFSNNRPRAAKILIEAGADQAVRDRDGNNIMHLLLCNHRGRPMWEISDLQKLLDLLDPRLVPSLLIERSCEDPGSLTPIARWIYTTNTSSRRYYSSHRDFDLSNENDDMVDVVRLVLDVAESTGQKHLELLDSSGSTPVHSAVKFQLPRILKLMCDRRPDLLQRENATGYTPADLAKDAWVAEATYDPIDYRGKNNSWLIDGNISAYSITKDPPESFIPGEEDDDKRSERKKIYDLCCQTASESGGVKRKLVTLFEANEVAKRLATRSNESRNGRGSDEQKEDEVSFWF